MIEIPLHQIVAGFLTIGIRLSGLMLFAPFFGSMSVSPRIKAALVVALSILLYPVVSVPSGSLPTTEWPLLVFGELLIGAVIGIAANLVFDAVQMAGQVLSVQMGFSLVNIVDPQTQVDSTVVALLHQTLALLIFLRLNVHLWLLQSAARSFRVLPPGSVHIGQAFTVAALASAGQVFLFGIQIAAPVFSATVLADVVLGMMGKASPQAPLMLLGTSIKMLLGGAILFGALKYWPSVLERFFDVSNHLSDRLLLLAR